MVMHWSSEIYRRHVLQVVVVDPSLRFWFSGLKYKAVLGLGNSKDAHLEILSCHPLPLGISTQNGLLLLLQGKRERDCQQQLIRQTLHPTVNPPPLLFPQMDRCSSSFPSLAILRQPHEFRNISAELNLPFFLWSKKIIFFSCPCHARPCSSFGKEFVVRKRV